MWIRLRPYGHPDHVQVHQVARDLAATLPITTLHESMVDREYLHFVETHVVVEAGLGERPTGRGLAAASDLGMPSLLIDLTIDVRNVLAAKRRAMAAHASQLPADAPAFALGEPHDAVPSPDVNPTRHPCAVINVTTPNARVAPVPTLLPA